jgi:hypothetical protein
LSNEQAAGTNYTFRNSGNTFVKIYSVTAMVLVFSRLIVQTCVFDYIQLLSTLIWERRDHKYISIWIYTAFSSL